MLNPQTGVVLLIVLTGLFALAGVLYSRRHHVTLEDFLASRHSVGLWLSSASLVASVAGGWILFSPAEAATWSGVMGVAGYALGQAAPLFAFAILGPRMREILPEGHSLGEYTLNRFGQAMHLFTLTLVLFYLFIFLSAEFTALATAMKLVTGLSPIWSAVIVAVGTCAYTAYGGLRASIFTDGIQFLVIVPLLALLLVVTLSGVGGFAGALDSVRAVSPQLLRPDHGPGLQFGATLFIAILAANLFHQGFWQRVYACRDPATLRGAFILSGLTVIPMLLVAGFFGLVAAGRSVPAEHASAAFFHVVTELLPPWAILVVLALALTLVISSADTLLNGMASALAVALTPFCTGTGSHRLLRSSRLITVLLVVPAILIASRGYSVLYLFLVADLLCAAAVFPVFYGMFARHLTGPMALVSCTLGLICGVAFFPRPDLTPWLPIPCGGNLLVSFSIALGISATTAALLDWFASRTAARDAFDFALLRSRVHVYEDQE